MTQWKKDLSAEEIRFLVGWFTETYSEEKYPLVHTPDRAEALYSKIKDLEEIEARPRPEGRFGSTKQYLTMTDGTKGGRALPQGSIKKDPRRRH